MMCSTAAIPSAEATWASIMPPVQSPMAYISSDVVLKFSSVMILPLSVFTPAASRPKPSVAGRRPTHMRTFSASITLSSPRSSVTFTDRASPASSMPPTFVPVRMDTLFFFIIFLITAVMSESMFIRMSGSISTMVTLLPRLL